MGMGGGAGAAPPRPGADFGVPKSDAAMAAGGGTAALAGAVCETSKDLPSADAALGSRMAEMSFLAVSLLGNGAWV